MNSNSYLNFIIEWQFCAALLSLMLLASYKLIRNPFLASSFLKTSFTLMLALPIICLLLKNSGFYMFAIFEASAPQVHPETSPVVASSAPSSSPTEIAKTAKTVKTASHLNAANIALLIILIYAAASLINLVVSYCRLRKFCLKQQAYRTLNHIPVYTSQSSSFPFCFGLFRPLIVIPHALTNNESDLEAALNHEKAHIDNKDHLYCVVQHLVKALYIINPVVWYLNRRFSENQEILADYLASEAVGNKERYVHSLLNLVKSNQWLGTPRLATGMAASKKQLMSRINFILTRNKETMKTTPNWKKYCVVLGLTGLVSISLSTKLIAQESPERGDNQDDTKADHKAYKYKKAYLETLKRHAMSADTEAELELLKRHAMSAETEAEFKKYIEAYTKELMKHAQSSNIESEIDADEIIIVEASEGDDAIEMAMQKIQELMTKEMSAKMAEAGIPNNADTGSITLKFDPENSAIVMEETNVVTKTLQIDENGNILEDQEAETTMSKHKTDIKIIVNGKEIVIDDKDQ